jgi:hypothetical protein
VEFGQRAEQVRLSLLVREAVLGNVGLHDVM